MSGPEWARSHAREGWRWERIWDSEAIFLGRGSGGEVKAFHGKGGAGEGVCVCVCGESGT